MTANSYRPRRRAARRGALGLALPTFAAGSRLNWTPLRAGSPSANRLFRTPPPHTTELASRSLNTAQFTMNRNAHSLQRQNELEQQLMSRSAPNDAVLPEPRPPPAKPRSDLDALFALTKRFCCVQIGNCMILLIAVPASIYCMLLSIGILAGFLGSIRFVEVQCAAKSEREKRDVFGRHWLLLMHLWLPYAAMTRAHEAWRFTAPVWAYALGTTVWIIFGLYQRALGLRPEIRLWTGAVVSVSFLAHVPYTDMGQPIEGLLVAGSIAFGELLGLTLEAQRAQVQAEVEREAQRGPASGSSRLDAVDVVRNLASRAGAS